MSNAASTVSTLILGKDVLGPLGLLFDMYQLYNRIQNERLVGAVGREADKARFEKKLSLIMDIAATDRAKRTRENPAQVKIRLQSDYRRYQAARDQHQQIRRAQPFTGLPVGGSERARDCRDQ